MNALEYILDGLAAALELERELGTRSVEIDRSLLAPPTPRPSVATAAASISSAPPALVAPAPVATAPVATAPKPTVPKPAAPSPAPAADSSAHPGVVFLHDRGLDAAGDEMLAKIVGALGLAGSTAVATAAPLPPAQVYVVLGYRALRKFFPGIAAEPGAWIAASDGTATLVTYSPEYILRFRTVTPAVVKIKTEMWKSLKGILRRLQNGQ